MKIKTKDIFIALRHTLPPDTQKYFRLKAETWCGSDKCVGCGTPVVLPDEIEISDISQEITNRFGRVLKELK